MTDAAQTRGNGRRRQIGSAALAVALLGGAIGVAAATTSVNSTPSVYTAIAPQPLAARHLAHSGKFSYLVAGVGGVPGTATSVVLQITASDGSKVGHLTVYPAGVPGGSAAILRWAARHTATAQLTVAIGAAGKVRVRNGPGRVTVTPTIVGFYAPAAATGATGPAGGVLTGTYPNPGLADGSVSTGNISGDGGSTGDLLTNNGTGAEWQAPAFASADTTSVVVHPTGDSSADGTQLRTAVASGVSAVYLEPGSYALGSSSLTVPDGVSIIGAGRDLTTITYAGSTNAITVSGTHTLSGVTLTANSVASGTAMSTSSGTLTLDRDAVTTSGTGTVVAVNASSSAEVDIVDSSITASGSGPFVEGLLVNNTNAEARIQGSDIKVSVTGTGDQAFGVNGLGPAEIRSSSITGTGPAGTLADAVITQAAGITVEVMDAQLKGSQYAAAAYSGTIRVATSKVDGTAAHNGGAFVTCVGDFDENWAALNTSCA